MTNEIRAAAERCFEYLNGMGPSIAYPAHPEPHVAFRAEASMLVRHVLFEHAADGDEDVTEDWLRSIGADHRLNGEWLVADPRTLDECVEVWCIFTDDGGAPGVIVKPSDCEDAPCIIANCTRSQLRDLLKALGVRP